MEEFSRNLNKRLIKNKIIKKIILLNKKNKIKNNKDEITSIALRNGYIHTLELMSEFNPNILVEDIRILFKEKDYDKIEKILLHNKDLVDMRIVYAVLNELLLEEITRYSNIELVKYLKKSKVFTNNQMLFKRIVTISFKPQKIEIYKEAFNHLIFNIHKEKTPFGTQKFFVEKALKTNNYGEFLKYFISFKNVDIKDLINILFSIPVDNYEYLEVLFNDEERKNKILKKYKEIRKEALLTKSIKETPSLRRVDELLKINKLKEF